MIRTFQLRAKHAYNLPGPCDNIVPQDQQYSYPNMSVEAFLIFGRRWMNSSGGTHNVFHRLHIVTVSFRRGKKQSPMTNSAMSRADGRPMQRCNLKSMVLSVPHIIFCYVEMKLVENRGMEFETKNRILFFEQVKNVNHGTNPEEAHTN